jgi:hypothetical protein
MWKILDKYGLVQSSMGQLDPSIACANGTGGGIPSMIGTAHSRFNDDEQKKAGGGKEFKDLSDSITKLSKSEEAAARIVVEGNKEAARINAIQWAEDRADAKQAATNQNLQQLEDKIDCA